MEQKTVSHPLTRTEPWGPQAVFMARDFCTLRTTVKQIRQEVQQERKHLIEQQRILEQMISLLTLMLYNNSKGLSQLANEVHTIFETLGGRSLKSELPEDVLRSFRNALLVRIRRSQAQIHKVRATLMHLPSADDEPSELLDVNEILKQVLRKLAGRHNTSKLKVKPSLDKQIIPQKYPPTASKEALDVLIAWRFGLVSEQDENGRFHIRSRLLNQYIEISLWDTGDCPDNDQLQKLYDPLSSIKNNIQSLAWAVYCLENIIGGHIFFHKEADSLFKNRMIILLPLAS